MKKDKSKDSIKRINRTEDFMANAKNISVNVSDIYRKEKEHEAEDRLRYDKEVKAEGKRIANMSCPVCKSKKKEFRHLTVQNGPTVYGGHNSHTDLGEYYICQHCGTMYVDLHKKEIRNPYKSFYR